MTGIVFTVEGMKCGGCSSKIESAFKELENELTTMINIENKTVAVDLVEGITPLQLKKTIEKSGFTVTKMETT